jgi:hypothetical protein
MSRISSLERREALPAELRWEEFASAIVEGSDKVEILDLKNPENRMETARYPRGLAFGEQSELRWVRRESGLHLVYISDEDKDLGEGSLPEPLNLVEGEPGSLLLWGERQADGKYYDGRIPRLLEYPQWAPQPKVGGRLAVKIRHYELREGDDAMPLFRCVRIAVAEDDQ